MWFRRRRCDDLTELSSVEAALEGRELVTTSETVPVEHITGTIARCCDFDTCFRPMRPELEQRLARLRTQLAGRHFPAVRLVRVDDRYFVADGHHRVALARDRGMIAVDAVVACHCHPAPQRLDA